ncbi:MAG: hypothetical protein NVS2B4_22700 [Ramlibacter sp.]
MPYLLATSEKKARWYAVTDHAVGAKWSHELLEVLDLRRVDLWPDKDLAKRAAMAMALSDWCYVQLREV